MANNFTLPTVNDTGDLLAISQFSNNASGGILFPLILLGIWATAFIGSVVEGRQAVRSWIFASFVAGIIGILLAVLGLLGSNWMYLLVLFIAFGVFWIRIQNPPVA